MSVEPKAYRILAVDDEAGNLDLLRRRLSRQGYEVPIASSASEAAAEIADRMPDMVLLDINMPEVSGLDFLKQLRASPKTLLLPVIMVSALTDTDSIVTAIQDGANDYVTKPINLPVLLARMETHLKMAALVQHLETQTQILSKLAALDYLTGIYNRRSMFDALEVELNRCRRSGRRLSVLMLDLDHFKRINDSHGHPAGDLVLREFASRAKQALRSTDILCRYGGEEFCVILPETETASALAAAERIRQAIGARSFMLESDEVTVTVSVGVASVPPEFEGELTELLERADKALYRAKQGGRNRVCECV
ncbi:MAG: diguanylate cyclase [Planctomycetes bacterium]|nr:diguanylate cyclase [Planctomycetota bacterium]